MSFTTEFTEDYMGIVHVGSGIVAGEEILQACRSMTALVQTTENFHYKLIDFSATREVWLSESDLEKIIEEDRVIAQSRPQAAVVIIAPNEKIRELAERWEKLVAELGWSTIVTRTRAEALAWLRERFSAAQVEI